MDARYMERAGSSVIGASYLSRLRQDGYYIVPNLISAADVEMLNQNLNSRPAETQC
jgi:hypothetical protein